MRIKKWRGPWLLSLAIAIALLGGWESFWRLQGFQPSVRDTWELWAKMRHRAAERGHKAVVLIGASRIQTGFHPDIFASVTGADPIMLAIDGSNPIPVLEDLAKDPDVTGTVVCSFIPMWLGEASEDFGRSREWIENYHDRKWSTRIETELSVFLQRYLVFRYRGLQPDQLRDDIKEGNLPNPPYAAMRPDRFRPADFSKADVERIREGRIEREKQFQAEAEPLSRAAFLEKVERINGFVKTIRDKGGDVVFVRFPSTGLVRELEAELWPREKYWNVLAANTGAFSIHFEDYESLSGFGCPDGSHLDIDDAKPFTRALAEILSKNQENF